uniref:ras GTPase-activating-like protein IQGAP1 isoform X2 n=1 Tax=Myxine glutinosa TaxID=7769 RepID=UPI00358F684B
MQNPNAMLSGLDKSLAKLYQEALSQVKGEKAISAQNTLMTTAEREMYDDLLTHAEIQGNINRINLLAALEVVEDAIEQGDIEGLFAGLQCPSLGLSGLCHENVLCYLQKLSDARQCKTQKTDSLEPLNKEELQAVVMAANSEAWRDESKQKSLRLINRCIRQGNAKETVRGLMQAEADLPAVHEFAAELYQHDLRSLQDQRNMGELSHEELHVAVEMLSAVAVINQALERGLCPDAWALLTRPEVGIVHLESDNQRRYMNALVELKDERTAQGVKFLTWNDIQHCVESVNAAVEDEHDRALAVGLVNEALEEGHAGTTLRALLLPVMKLAGVYELADLYQYVLQSDKVDKARVTRDPLAMLWWEEIQDGIFKANRDDENAYNFAVCVAAINTALEEESAMSTLKLLQSPTVGILGVVPHCAEVYQLQLAEAKEVKAPYGDDGGDWVRHSIRRGSDYYFNLSDLQGTWKEPEICHFNIGQLSREEIQAIVLRETATYNREQLWLSHESLVVCLQARCRGWLARRDFGKQLAVLQVHRPAAVRIQACWKGFVQRRCYRERMDFFSSNVETIVLLQSWVRMWKERKKYLQKQKFYRDHVDAVIKIQTFFRANRARGDYRTLIKAPDAPVSVLRKFVHLLEQSEGDLQEELEVLRLRQEVMSAIRSNQQLEQDLNTMDIKIGLLVKNRITLEDVVSHSMKLNKKNKGQVMDMMTQDKHKGLKSLSKEKRQTLEAYQHLFYLLQTNPNYLAKLIFQMPQNRFTKFMDAVIFSVYNYGSNLREEYLLLKLFKTALEEEIKCKVDHLQEIVTGNPTVIKMVLSFNRGPRGQNSLRDLLAPFIQDVINDNTLHININPVEVYKAWVNHMESQTGEARYGMRYMAKVLKNSLQEKFPDANQDELLKIVGNLLYYRYMNPAIVAPDAFDVVDVLAGGQLQAEQRRNLGSVAKVLQFAAAGKLFDGESSHMASMNDYLLSAHQKFREFFEEACEVLDPEEMFNIDEYSDLVTVIKPVVHTTAEEIINTHMLLLEHEDTIAVDHNDPLHELLHDLGDVPSLSMLVGDTMEAADTTREAQLAKTEISLMLKNKFDVPKADDGMHTLLLRTKQHIVDMIRAQSGETLLDILKTPAKSEQAFAYEHMMRRRLGRMDENCSSSLEQKKNEVMKNLQILEAATMISSANNYQELINEIAKDLRNQRRHRQRRRVELLKLQQTLDALTRKATFFGEQADYYNQYIHTCLDNLDRGRKLSRHTVHSGNAQRNRKAKQMTLRYTAARLHEKGVLLEIENLQQNQFRNVQFDITPAEEIGSFDVKAKFMGVNMEKVQLNFQDLLQLQYEGVSIMRMFDKIKVNVNLLVFLINNKFYGK